MNFLVVASLVVMSVECYRIGSGAEVANRGNRNMTTFPNSNGNVPNGSSFGGQQRERNNTQTVPGNPMGGFNGQNGSFGGKNSTVSGGRGNGGQSPFGGQNGQFGGQQGGQNPFGGQNNSFPSSRGGAAGNGGTVTSGGQQGGQTPFGGQIGTGAVFGGQ